MQSFYSTITYKPDSKAFVADSDHLFEDAVVDMATMALLLVSFAKAVAGGLRGQMRLTLYVRQRLCTEQRRIVAIHRLPSRTAWNIQYNIDCPPPPAGCSSQGPEGGSEILSACQSMLWELSSALDDRQ
mmetsp:Transcript_35065/g.99412  ORF Transcript_35065/g.99412 Transcript_35065/m.99412 type:complete len:129 (+) Transcript_35065:722-1108(+)